MKAIQFTRYGSSDVLELKEVEKPLPKDSQVRIHAASINARDRHTMRSS
jgi:NADPH:quinone reductase-like Zn-dependent oxidoreductase